MSPIETSKEHSTQGAVASLGDAIKKKLAENGDFVTGAVLSIPETGICGVLIYLAVPAERRPKIARLGPTKSKTIAKKTAKI